jgi:hypothetical protein
MRERIEKWMEQCVVLCCVPFHSGSLSFLSFINNTSKLGHSFLLLTKHPNFVREENGMLNTLGSTYIFYKFFIVLQGQEYHQVLTLQYQSTQLFELYLTSLCMEHLIMTGFDLVCQLYETKASVAENPGITSHYSR